MQHLYSVSFPWIFLLKCYHLAHDKAGKKYIGTIFLEPPEHEAKGLRQKEQECRLLRFPLPFGKENLLGVTRE